MTALLRTCPALPSDALLLSDMMLADLDADHEQRLV